jgi:hypothetical protein
VFKHCHYRILLKMQEHWPTLEPSQLSHKSDKGILDYREQLALLWGTARSEQTDNHRRSNEDRRLTGKR